jgi:hypothetical protein
MIRRIRADRRSPWRAGVLAVAIFAAAACGGEPGRSGEATAASQPAATGGGSAQAAAGGWLAPLKDLPLGPGRLAVDFSIRSRYEHYANYNVKQYGTDERDDLLLLRTRLGLAYRLTPPGGGSAPRFYVQFQDARHWLSDLERDDFPQTCPYFDQFDVREAYVEWRRLGGTPLGFKVGRQAIWYADKRVFGPGNWGNVGRYWWDAAKLYVETDPVRLDLLYGRRVIREPVTCDDRHFDFDMLAAYARFRRLPVRLDAFYVLRYNDEGGVTGESGRGDRRTHSVGLFLDGKAGRWDYGGTGVWQFGTYGHDDICAFGGNVRLGYTFPGPWKPRLGAEFTYASGDGDPRDGRHGTFDGVFGAIDSLYGRMNLLSWMNLEDYQVSASVQPAKGLKLSVDCHLFRRASDRDAWYWCSGKPARSDPAGTAARTIGGEIDLLAKWKLNGNWEILVGYAHFFPGRWVRGTAGSDDHADWLFSQVTFQI